MKVHLHVRRRANPRENIGRCHLSVWFDANVKAIDDDKQTRKQTGRQVDGYDANYVADIQVR